MKNEPGPPWKHALIECALFIAAVLIAALILGGLTALAAAINWIISNA